MNKITEVPLGKVFGRWTTTGVFKRVGGNIHYEVECVCSNTSFVYKGSLVSGASKSCGCLNLESAKSRVTHQKIKTPIYYVWGAMVQRILNPSARNYPAYGGRGLTISDDWRKFEGFYRDMGDPPFTGATLERVNNNLGYSKENCKWATSVEQANNKRNNRKFDFRGELYSLKQLSELSVVKVGTLKSRLYRYNWPVEVAVETPVAAKPKPNNAPH